jgi:DNA-binding PadR family transcriptional regulator
MAKRRVANPLAFAVLGSLSERPMHPYEISTILRARGKDQSIKLNYGSLYSVVATLEKHGLIVAQETVREGNRPERTVYAITEAGLAEFQDWLAELLGRPAREYTQLEAGLAYLPGCPPDRAAELLEQRVAELDEEIAAIAAAHASPVLAVLPRLFWVESEYRLTMLRAEREFAATLAGDIRDGTLEGSGFWRRLAELTAAGEATFAEMMADPERYFGKEAGWLTQLPEESM